MELFRYRLVTNQIFMVTKFEFNCDVISLFENWWLKRFDPFSTANLAEQTTIERMKFWAKSTLHNLFAYSADAHLQVDRSCNTRLNIYMLQCTIQ